MTLHRYIQELRDTISGMTASVGNFSEWVVSLEDENVCLKAELATLHAVDREAALITAALGADNTRLIAELAVLRPLAALGEWVLREGSYVTRYKGVQMCDFCHADGPGFVVHLIHADGCPIPDLLAQLEVIPDA